MSKDQVMTLKPDDAIAFLRDHSIYCTAPDGRFEQVARLIKDLQSSRTLPLDGDVHVQQSRLDPRYAVPASITSNHSEACLEEPTTDPNCPRCADVKAYRDSIPLDGDVVERRLWLWKNFVDGKPEYWAFDNPFPTEDGGDPLTLGEPCGWAILKPSVDGRPGYPVERVEAAIRTATRSGDGELLVRALKKARSAIRSLDDDTLGFVTVPPEADGQTGFQYPIRDELLSEIDAALSSSGDNT